MPHSCLSGQCCIKLMGIALGGYAVFLPWRVMLYQIDGNCIWWLCRIPVWAANAVSKWRKIKMMTTGNRLLGMLMLYQMGEILGWCQQKSGLRGARCWHQRGNMPNWCQHWPRFPQSSTWKREEMIQQARRDEGCSPDKSSHQHEKEGKGYSKQGEIRAAFKTNPVIHTKKRGNDTASKER